MAHEKTKGENGVDFQRNHGTEIYEVSTYKADFQVF